MLVLHGAWLEGALHVWAERWPGGERRSDAPSRSPFDPDEAELGAALASVVGESVDAPATPVVAWLPTIQHRPVHSREVWRVAARPALQPWQVTALALDWRTQFALLGKCRANRRPASGVLAGEDLLAWAELQRFAGALVARKAYLPALLAGPAHYESRWLAAFGGPERQRLLDLAKRLPAAARCLDTAAIAPPAAAPAIVTEAFVTEAVDRLVRISTATTLSRAHAAKGRYSSAHDAWLAALRGDGRIVRWDSAPELAALAAENEEWRRPVDLASRATWRLVLRLEEPKTRTDDEWFLRYLAQPFAQPSQTEPLEDASRRSATEGELALLSLGQAAALCPLVGGGGRGMTGRTLTTGEAHALLSQYAPLLEAAGLGVEAPAWWTKGGRHARIELLAQATAGADDPRACSLRSLVHVNWQLALGGQPVSMEELEKLAGGGEGLVRFRDRWVEIDRHEVDEALRTGRRHQAEERSAGDIVRLMLGMDRSAHGLRVGGVQARGWFQRFVDRLRGAANLDTLPPPVGFHGELRPYQQRGYAWLEFLRQWGFGACLADDMGLGKTIQALALVARERERGEARPVLLVCPTSVIGNWQHEAARFTPDLAVMRHHGPDRALGELFAEEAARHALVITSYALLPRDYAALRRVQWAGVVLDEAQNIKNPETRQSQAARALSAGYRVALTGTPIENHVGDLWSIMDFLNPGLLGSRSSFRDRFLRPIQAGADPAAREDLRRAVSPFVLRRLKTDRAVIADLPQKIEAKVYCALTREQAGLYADVLHDLEQGLRGVSGIARRGLVLATLTRLKQVCNHPVNYAPDDGDLAGRSGKLERLGEMLEELLDEGDRALVFTQFAEMGALLQRHIGQMFGFEPPFLHGGVPLRGREQMVSAFQAANGPPVFVLSLRAGGFGLNLTAANHVFHFDRWWNPAVENQATDRAFRIGQTRNVMVHTFICAGTLEDRIDAMIASKKGVAEEVIGSGENLLTELSDEDLMDALALAPGAVADDREAESGSTDDVVLSPSP